MGLGERQVVIPIHNEKKVQQTKDTYDSWDNKNEDMLEVMNMYRIYYMEGTPDLLYSDDENAIEFPFALLLHG